MECMNCKGSGCMNCKAERLDMSPSDDSLEKEFNERTLLYIEDTIVYMGDCILRPRVSHTTLVSFHYLGR